MYKRQVLSSSNGLEKYPKLRFKGFSAPWHEIVIGDLFRVTRGYVLPTTAVKEKPQDEYIFPVYSSQTKDEGLMGYYNQYLYENAITWTTDGANAGTVHFRDGKFYCTNVCGVLLNEDGNANRCIAEILGSISKKYVSYVGNPKLMNNVMSEIRIHIPSVAEQKKIDELISALDLRIVKQRELIEHLKKYKRGAIEAIFNRTISFSSNTEDSWKEFRLGEFARRITRKNGQTTDIPLTISAQYGLIDQREFFSKTVASSDMSGYYLLHKGEFAYNRSTSSEYPFGSIKRLDKYDKGAVSTLYLCFDANEEIMDSDFIMWYFESSRWHNGVWEICAEGARNHGLLNVPTAGFFDTVHYLPSNKAEQKRIVAFLSTIDERYTRAFSELEELNNLKNGLYQRLFI
mgnify:CR=1 FL=1